jgi:hypothetical protein
MWNMILSFLWSRMKEPSSYAALAGLFASLHLQLSPGTLQHIIDVLTIAAGVAGVLLREANKVQVEASYGQEKGQIDKAEPFVEDAYPETKNQDPKRRS